ncbi:PepSY-like domain-containing protein [Myroides marinus]|uniref:Putative beta-lactamase-inhibitor-like, PepSY-like n=1 Tax=Myroides marinus TaxID=703342 RepID=A0A1H6YCL9_9FLAO|nr:PepSY-like domain-containing protein [Myroides marinus]MDM1376275.1 PepSY-like domain-containing protein [Myroides marinus]MDM1377918.1 PepSY-like domain-containing protein [Myroides marinus]MDM1383415.1 PepSY-like domain-containing protein [Myroides marinus]MDM1385189.1 PepSY-like domain-containing protein [Myroides marinus]MDM1392402.1 PepSY-like domain-containing protein [Myroides marinus]
MKNVKLLLVSVLMSGTLMNSQSAMAQDVVITKTELPKKASTFIDTHFKGKEVSLIEKDKDFLSTSYKVKFVDNVEVEFDKSGEWDEVDGNKSAIPTSFILKPIVTYVTTNYKETTITKIEKEARRYEVKLSNGLELEFSKDGKFKKIDK